MRSCITLGLLPDRTRADGRWPRLLWSNSWTRKSGRLRALHPRHFPGMNGSKIPEQVNDMSAIRKLRLSGRKISALRNSCY
jgi:hypothetical protein